MQTLILIWTVVNNLLPLLVQTVRVVEQAFPVSGMGQQKLEMVRGTLEKAYEASGEVQTAFSQVWPILNTLINSIVAMQKVLPQEQPK